MTDKIIVYIGRVVSTYDSKGMGRIKVKITDFDRKTNSIADLPYAFPLLPKSLHIIPQVDEMVLVFIPSNYNTSQRYWVGPIVPQLNKLDYANFDTDAKSILVDSPMEVGKNPEIPIDSKGVYPETNDIGILGKKNTDVLLKDNEVWVRAGKYKKVGNNETFSPSPTYLMLRNESGEDENGKQYDTTATMVADKILLLGTKSKDKFDLSDPDRLIKSSEFKHILEKAHALPYGDVLVEFLEMFVNVFATHTHAYPGLPPVPDESVNKLNNFNLKDILSETIKIN